jgi:LysR family transcriptional regulator, glycine cleavage system transcriptional activator
MTARLPSLNGLRAFEAAARHLSFTQAASELNVTQTAISHQIKRLEQELGVRPSRHRCADHHLDQPGRFPA